MSNWLKHLIAGKELRALERYRNACHLVIRWNAGIEASAKTGEWISDIGEDRRGENIQQFREELRSSELNAKGGLE